MKARVPITLDPEIHRLVKQTARKKHTTVSGLIESLLKSEAVPQTKGIVASMAGSASLRSTVTFNPSIDLVTNRFLHFWVDDLLIDFCRISPVPFIKIIAS